MEGPGQIAITRARVDDVLVPANLLIIQASPFCNIDCSYCYLADRANKKLMTAETAEAVVKFLAGIPLAKEPLTICWHAGEPLAVPRSFYERAFTAFAAGPTAVRQNIQTNGTLITDEWCRFFKKWSVQIGLSIDGPQAIHDRHRVDRAGRGTFERVMRGVSKLREHEIPFSVIAVLTRDSLDSPDELWSFFKSAGIAHVGFNIDEKEGVYGNPSLRNAKHLAAFRRFMSRIAELHESDPTLQFREIEDMQGHLIAPPGAQVERADNRPGAILNIDAEGNVTTFSPELLGRAHPAYGLFSWINVHRDSWQSLSQNPGFKRAWADIQSGIEKCRRTCQYFSLCGGGCPSNKLSERGTFSVAETDFCRFHIQTVADVMIDRLERRIDRGLISNAPQH